MAPLAPAIPSPIPMKSYISLIEPLEARIAPAFAPIFNLAGLDGTNGFSTPGAAAGNYSGASDR